MALCNISLAVMYNCSGTYKFAAGVAFHGLCLTVASIVIRPTTFVARRGPVGCDTIATTAALITTTEATTTSTHARAGVLTWVWAVAGDMAHLAAAIAATSGCTTTDTQRGTISLDVA